MGAVGGACGGGIWTRISVETLTVVVGALCRFTQHNLPACKPVLTLGWVMMTFWSWASESVITLATACWPYGDPTYLSWTRKSNAG
ncbi:ALA-interacting subunit 5-like [Phoenix dactylifera]|uniref:ALA-interacting subunit 5-like n=1 Tax=Phoenix dactylifera TaxID=42345 RepID=A0A8B8ZB09_PHODC|nr:ALA-interacting subunit 5-like [Phoenix dactylifera]XP_038970478.1 ALA-interacting subunit 5-like [Phoenix dactylifera]XP_038970479.1 ALA-interacting subunit 5-like [Phoenix dactylifera]